MPLRTLSALALCAGALAACGGDEEPAGNPPTTEVPRGVPAGTLVQFEKSGGIAGVSESLEVSEEGEAVLELGQPEPTGKEFALGAGELEKLRAAVEAADLGGVRTPSVSACADCFVYEISTAAGSATYDDAQASGLTDDAEVPDSVTALAATLGEIAEANR